MEHTFPSINALQTNRLGALLFILTILFAYLLVFTPRGLPIFQESDHLIFLYDAERMLRGEVIYLDFFQFTLPGTQLIYLFFSGLFGPKYWIFGFVVILYTAVLFALGLYISRQVLPAAWAYLPPVIFAFFGLRWFSLDSPHRMLSPIFILAGVSLLLRRITTTNAAMAGGFCALASFFTQPRGILGVAAFIIFIIINGIFEKAAYRQIFVHSLALISGFAITIGFLCGYFAYSAGLDNFVDATVIHPSRYYGLHPENTYANFYRQLTKAMSADGGGRFLASAASLFQGIVLPISVVAFFIYFFLRRRRHDWQYWRAPVLLGITAAVFYAGTTAPMHLRFFSTSIPALILLAWMIQETNLVPRSIVTGSIALLVIAGFTQAILFHVRGEFAIVDLPAGRVAVRQPNPQFERLIWLRDQTRPGDLVYEVYEPFVNFPLYLRNPTRIGQVFPYAYTPQAHVMEAVADLERSRPRFIVWDNAYNMPPKHRTAGDSIAPMYEFLVRNYSPVGPVYIMGTEPIQIWERMGE